MRRGLLFLWLIAGCGDDPMILPPPPDDGAIVRPPGGGARRDGGRGDAATDGGDAGPEPCVVVPPGDPDNTATLQVAGGDPIDFVPTRAFVTWNAAACADPTLLVALTVDACDPGIGERIVFHLREEGIGTVLRPGPTTLSPEVQEALAVRYVVPSGGEGAAATWGDCPGAEGELEFLDVGSLPGERIALTFDLLLSDCDAVQIDPLLSVVGSIDLTVNESIDDVCAAP